MSRFSCTLSFTFHCYCVIWHPYRLLPLNTSLFLFSQALLCWGSELVRTAIGRWKSLSCIWQYCQLSQTEDLSWWQMPKLRGKKKEKTNALYNSYMISYYAWSVHSQESACNRKSKFHFEVSAFSYGNVCRVWVGGRRRIKKWSVSGAVRLQDCPSAESGLWWGTSSGWQLLLVTRLPYSSNLARNIQPPLSFEKAEAVDISWSLLIACWRQLNPRSFEIYISITTFQSSRGNRVQHEKIMELFYLKYKFDINFTISL